jgi:hypothetical protein
MENTGAQASCNCRECNNPKATSFEGLSEESAHHCDHTDPAKKVLVKSIINVRWQQYGPHSRGATNRFLTCGITADIGALSFFFNPFLGTHSDVTGRQSIFAAHLSRMESKSLLGTESSEPQLRAAGIYLIRCRKDRQLALVHWTMLEPPSRA